jgi:hypothetical protein
MESSRTVTSGRCGPKNGRQAVFLRTTRKICGIGGGSLRGTLPWKHGGKPQPVWLPVPVGRCRRRRFLATKPKLDVLWKRADPSRLSARWTYLHPTIQSSTREFIVVGHPTYHLMLIRGLWNPSWPALRLPRSAGASAMCEPPPFPMFRFIPFTSPACMSLPGLRWIKGRRESSQDALEQPARRCSRQAEETLVRLLALCCALAFVPGDDR